MTPARAHLWKLLDTCQRVLSEELSPEYSEFLASVLKQHERELTEIICAAPAEADYPSAWPMLAQALRALVGAQLIGDRQRSQNWAATAFALQRLVRHDFEALRGMEAQA